jgi:hypothetical protein
MKKKKNLYSEKNLLTFSLNLDPDPELDPGPHSSKRLDLDAETCRCNIDCYRTRISSCH